MEKKNFVFFFLSFFWGGVSACLQTKAAPETMTNFKVYQKNKQMLFRVYSDLMNDYCFRRRRVSCENSFNKCNTADELV